MEVLAIPSAGGHRKQFFRLLPAFEKHQSRFASTKPRFADTVQDFEFYCGANRKDKLGIKINC